MEQPVSSRFALIRMGVITAMAALSLGAMVSAAPAADAISITYISADAIYINGGTENGLSIGDTLVVRREGRVKGRLLVTHVSSHSAACSLLAGDDVRVGDVVPVASHAVADHGTAPSPGVTVEPPNVPPGSRTIERRRRTRVRGYLGYQHVWQRDLGDAGLSWSQPAATFRLAVSNIGGKEVGLKVRHRSLVVRRSSLLADQPGGDEWIHRLSEASITVGSDRSTVEGALGRVLSPYVRGIGYIDGAYLTVRVADGYRVGAAAGTAPDPGDSRFRSDQLRVGGFVAFEHGNYDGRRLSTTLAVSTSYAEGLVSREFVYLQNRLSFRRTLSLYQSVELDFNRAWRRELSGESWTFSNLYLTANWQPASWLGFDGAYDSRKNVWTYYTMNTPDSLFDDTMRQGVNGGLTLRAPRGITFRAHGGIRYGESKADEVRFASTSLTMRNFVMRTHHLSLRLSRSQTQFTTAYRPIATYRFPSVARVFVTLGGGAYLYDSAGIQNDSYFYDVGLQRTFAGRYYTSGNVRHYTGGLLQSVQGDLEVGINF